MSSRSRSLAMEADDNPPHLPHFTRRSDSVASIASVWTSTSTAASSDAFLSQSSLNIQPIANPPISNSNSALTGMNAKTSKYDFVKVRIWLDGHYHVLSRYLVARSLTGTLMPKYLAIRISLRCKKRLVDRNQFDISSEDWKKLLEEEVRAEAAAENERINGNGSNVNGGQNGGANSPQSPTPHAHEPRINMERFQMIHWFISSRTPLIILLYGTSLLGKSTLATKLGNHLNFGNILHAAHVYQVRCSITQEQLQDLPPKEHQFNTHQNDVAIPLTEGESLVPSESSQTPALSTTPMHLLPFSSEEELEREYDRRCAQVRLGLVRDITKILNEGRSVIIEGTLIDPCLFQDLKQLSTTTSTASDTSLMGTSNSSSSSSFTPVSASDTSSPSSPSQINSNTAQPIVVSFHVTVPLEKHRLILHNRFNQQSSSRMHTIPSSENIATSASQHTDSSLPAVETLSITSPATTATSLPNPAAFVRSSSKPNPYAAFFAPRQPTQKYSSNNSSSGGVAETGNTNEAFSLSPSMIWRNLRWIESIVARRHQRWKEVGHAIKGSDNQIAQVTEVLSQHLIESQEPQTVHLNSSPLAAVDFMHARVLQAMQAKMESTLQQTTQQFQHQ